MIGFGRYSKDKNIVFGSDKYLGGYLQKQTGRKMRIWQGACVVHENFSEKHLVQLITINKKARVIAHPECQENLLKYIFSCVSELSLVLHSSGSFTLSARHASSESFF